MNTQLRILLVTFLFVTCHPCARATGSEANRDRVVYESAFYSAFAPRTALDMVKQTPGFVLAEDEELRRGFAGAVGNVLIDGKRLSAKSQTASDVLQRIPAGEVLRIELLRGSEVAGDASGAALLANVVRTPSTGGGAWALGAELANRDRAAPNGWFGWGGRRGVTEYSLGGSTYALQRELPGERDVRDGAGHLSARRVSTSPREFAEYGLNGQAARLVAGGRLVLTGQVHYSRYHEDSTLLTTSPAGAQLENELIPYTESERTGELGLTWQRDAGIWDLDLSTLATRKRYRSHVRSTQSGDDDARDLEFTQALARASGETILRGTLSRALGAGHFETGAEIALNTLEGAMELALDLGAGPFPIDVPNANLSVREQRVEAFVSQAWTIDEYWSFDSRLAAETSRLDFTGDTNQSVSLTYVKPRVQVTRKLGAHQLQARVFRDVGQLDFTDFVSAAEVSDDVINGGNPDLKPQTAWAAEIDADLRFPRDAALRLRGFRHWLDDVVDLIPVGPPAQRIDAPGNISRGTLTGIEISARTPLAPLLSGGSLKLAGTFQDAMLRDPVTGRRRTISEFPERKLRVDLREDIPGVKLSWGVSWTTESESVKHRLIERDAGRKSRQLDAFIETTALEGFTVRLTLLSILDDAQQRERRFYSPDRAGTLVETESSRWHPGHWWLISMSGSF